MVPLKGKLFIDFFRSPQLLLPDVALRLKLSRSTQAFCLVGDDADAAKVKVEIISAVMKVKHLTVDDNVHRAIMNNLKRSPARYNYPRILYRTLVVASGQNQVIKVNVFNNETVRRLIIAVNTNADFTGRQAANPFHYRKFGLQRVQIYRGGNCIIDADTTHDTYMYSETMENLNLTSDGNGITLEDFPNHYMLVFDLTSAREANSEVYLPDLAGEPLRVEMNFSLALTDAFEIFLMSEKISAVLVDSEGKVLRDG